ncbi:zinc ribbon domain-containing protein [Hyalangium sp.]|uniref:zinc ribbon domain-containing protein n=1 Tax=Hyalangium sp. TaxID=2028555 RepID=UPI002D425753|nr:zinc ribbon domain-containing protein [Hyalangium sp.]HYI01586.1 zinc ribbon domain-containing protein [Hyalangium sp.]
MASVEAQCQRCHSRLEAEDLRCPVCALPTPKPPRAAAREQARVIRCSNCGAAIAYSVEAQAPKCAFCASEMRTETQEDPIDQADRFVPFEVGTDQAHEALKTFLGKGGFFRPQDLASRAAVDSLQPLWWPGWKFDAQVEVTWTADTDAGAHRSAWAPHSGATHLELHNILVSASRGLTLAETQALSSSYDISKAKPKPEGPPGAQVELFDVTRSGARRQILSAVESTAREHIAKADLPGRRHRNLRAAVALSGLDTAHYALPAYVLAYRYGKKLYRVVVHGQDPSCVLGEKPVSWAKVAVAVLMALALVIVFLLIQAS